jgi:hypothetical protein
VPPAKAVVDEVKALSAIAVEPAGAVFKLADLQLHTPVDRAFKARAQLDSAARRSAFAKKYVAAAVDRGLGVIAVTEHNDVSWIERIRKAANAADLLMFPAFEIASSEGIHVLCLFEPYTPVDQLDEILVELGLPKDSRFHTDGSPRLAGRSLVDLVAFVQDERNGLCILAHVDREDGVLHRLKGEPRIRAWTECDAHAVQCAKNPDLMGSGFNRKVLENVQDRYWRKRPYACIQTSDARSLEEIGTKATHIKLSSPTIEGLRQAFYDPGSRVRFPDAHDPGQAPRILAARWDGAFLRAEIPFNENLNCLVGGKGTAKSTVIETIRHAFELDIPSDTIRLQAFELLSQVFRSSARVSILIEVTEPAQARYVIERTGNDPSIVRSAETGQIVEGLRPAALLKPSIYGQKEIYETAQRLSSQLALLDRYCSEELSSLDREVRTLREEIGELGEEISRELKKVKAADAALSELPQLKERVRLFKKAGISKKAEDQQRLRREREGFERASATLAEYQEAVDGFRDAVGGIAEITKLGPTPHRELVDTARKAINDLGPKLEKTADSADDLIEKAGTSLDAARSKWEPKADSVRTQFQRALRELPDEVDEEQLNEYLDVDSRIGELEALEQQTAPRKNAVNRLSVERREKVARLREVRRQVFAVRDTMAGELTKRLAGSVQVTVEAQGNREDARRFFEGLRSGMHKTRIRTLVDRPDFSPAEFASLCREGSEKLAHKYGLSPNDATSLIGKLGSDGVDQLEVLELPDKVEIKFNVRGREDEPEFRPLDRLSAGQRSTAILLLALLEGDEPLLLDQPEDDLDNLFIYEEIVQRLRSAKEQRQFVIATHNANIPVLGDAEQIVVLETASGDDGRVHARVCERGSIDDAPLVKPVEDVLEGGPEAFERRKRKYGF